MDAKTQKDWAVQISGHRIATNVKLRNGKTVPSLSLTLLNPVQIGASAHPQKISGEKLDLVEPPLKRFKQIQPEPTCVYFTHELLAEGFPVGTITAQRIIKLLGSASAAAMSSYEFMKQIWPYREGVAYPYVKAAAESKLTVKDLTPSILYSAEKPISAATVMFVLHISKGVYFYRSKSAYGLASVDELHARMGTNRIAHCMPSTVASCRASCSSQKLLSRCPFCFGHIHCSEAQEPSSAVAKKSDALTCSELNSIYNV